MQGLPARKFAVSVLAAVLGNGRALDDRLLTETEEALSTTLAPRDRAFARLVVMTVLRRKRALDHMLDKFLSKPLPSKNAHVQLILLSAAAQLIYHQIPPHAVISTAVEQVRRGRNSQHLAGLANAVLRRISDQRNDLIAAFDKPDALIPSWLWSRWVDSYGENTARRIAEASLNEAALDLTAKKNAREWIDRLGASALSTGGMRLKTTGRIDQVEGFSDGEWWVQDAAASIPAQLFGDVTGKCVLDLCAAPGGKTAQLAAAGALVTALDSDENRLARLKSNLERLRLGAELINADATEWQPTNKFNSILLDAPCSATGTIRRHPDILHLRRATDTNKLSQIQSRLLDAAFEKLEPNGTMIYCTCSLEPEESEHQIATFLERTPEATHRPIKPSEAGVKSAWLNPKGDLRTLPFHDPNLECQPANANLSQQPPGMDGFFAARVSRSSR